MRGIHINDPQINIIASILDLHDIFSEVMVAFKYGPLARVEKQTMSYKLELLKIYSKMREVPYKWSTIKDQIKLWHTIGPWEKI